MSNNPNTRYNPSDENSKEVFSRVDGQILSVSATVLVFAVATSAMMKADLPTLDDTRPKPHCSQAQKKAKAIIKPEGSSCSFPCW